MSVCIPVCLYVCYSMDFSGRYMQFLSVRVKFELQFNFELSLVIMNQEKASRISIQLSWLSFHLHRRGDH